MIKVNKKISVLFLSMTVFSCCLTAAHTQVGAAEQVIDRIAAIVGTTTISLRELMATVNRLKQNLARQKAKVPDDAVLIPSVLEELIVKKLQLLEAEKLGIAVDENTLDQTMTQIAKNNQLTLAEMKTQIEQDGGVYAEVRESVREEMIINQLKQREVVDRVEVPESTIEKALAEVNADTRFRFSYLRVVLPEETAERDSIRQWFADLRTKLLLQDNFDTMAPEVAAREGVRYKSMKARTLAELPSSLRNQALSMEVGDITPVIRTGKALYLFYLDSKRGTNIPEVTETQYHIRHILIRTDAMNTEKQVARKLWLIKKRLEKGGSFEALAKKYSQDPGSSFKGGELGWIPTTGLVKEFAQQVENAERGKIVGPFATDFGLHLLQVLGEREHDISSRVQRQNIIAQLRQKESASAMREWLLRLRENQHIDIRL